MHTNRIALAGWLLVGLVCPAWAGSYLLKEKLDTVPRSARIEKPKAVRVGRGRLKGQKALVISDGSVHWELKPTRGDVFVEFWMKPHAWDARTQASVVVARFQVGGKRCRIEKPAGKSQLDLVVGDTHTQSVPIYDWTRQPWMRKGGEDLWHYVHVALSGGRAYLSVDGFAARTLRECTVKGSLTGLTLEGKPGTAYSWVHVIRGPRPTAPALRTRFRSLYRGRPELHKNTVTIPMLKRKPTIDGTVEPGEWDEAARLVGFVSLRARPGALRAEKITAHMGYDRKYVYMTIRTPYQGPIGAKHWQRYDMPLWGEASYEMFFHPPFTGTPDFCQLVGNPYGDQADLKMLNLGWNGRWDWKTTIHKDEWVAEFRADFVGIKTPPPGDRAVWTGNMVNSCADAGWCWTQRYNDVGSFGVFRFEKGAPVVRPGHFAVGKDAVSVPMEIRGGAGERTLRVALEVYGEKDVLPASEDARTLRIGPGTTRTVQLSAPLKGLTEGTVALYVRDGETELYFHSVRFPAAAPVVRVTHRNRAAKTPKRGAAKPKVSPEAERAYNRTWSAAELGQTLLESSTWQNNTLGLSDDVPRPWTPMTVNGQTVACWGRTYVYRDSILPVQITSRGERLLADAPRLVVTSKGRTFAFDKASVEMRKVNDGLVRVRSVSAAGPFRVEVSTLYEFDGMGKVTLSLESPEGTETVEGLSLEFALRSDRSILYHLTCGASGHAPASDSGAVPAGGLTLDLFRELVWLGDQDRGWCWFAESLEGWSIRDEKAIQVIAPVKGGARRLRIKLADKPLRLERPYRLVFGMQATPTRARPKNFRKQGDLTACRWCWFWGDGQYYPFQSLPAKAKAQIDKERAAGREVMPCSSITFYGAVRFYKSMFGEVPNPGLRHREMMLWRELWTRSTIPVGLPTIPKRHTAPGQWYGKKYQPLGLCGPCAASPHQDHYIWKLHQLIDQTGLGALYLDQPIYRCSNAHHGCGYVNYAGRWTPRMPIFAMRRMLKRIHRLFYDKHGKTLIRWHSSNQLMVPVISFADVFWDGENYGSGPSKVFEFYSKLLPPGRMQAQHTGIQFGFAPDLLPEFESRYAPGPASARDMMGWLFVHDGSAWPAHTPHPKLVAFLQEKRLGAVSGNMHTAYYWQPNSPVHVEPDAVKFILHHSPERRILILFNRSDATVDASVRLDGAALGIGGAAVAARDMITGATVSRGAGALGVPIRARDLRMLEIVAGKDVP